MNCEQHDYLEIACTFKLEISLLLNNKDIFTGIATDIRYNQHKEHCILLKNGQKDVFIILTDIKSMKAITINPHFTQIHFD